eukprot:363954-Chlamydomonas_euryale.AAC.4
MQHSCASAATHSVIFATTAIGLVGSFLSRMLPGVRSPWMMFCTHAQDTSSQTTNTIVPSTKCGHSAAVTCS